ncbi:amino acid ABC transporter permease [Salinibacterium sp. G-O1]|uniref:amino acid ABC transporter permease n=1 Tax=Salinibacterium sp. G-O1 TaxID=3046208 RepID=UPI0024BB333F|nr:amino acid ABC transporter permease [Salinibacterium sp. G-O1]MDJ0333858.1 amino acid ABC transporter permease [Salinibacterium sp. G-O1]
MTLYFGDIFPYLPIMLEALWVSIYVTALSFVVGSFLGLFIYLARASRFRALRWFGRGYVEVIRNTPLLVQLYLIYFGLGQVGINFNPLWSVLIGMSLNNAAYTAEIFRAGINAVPNGLREAGRALGMRYDQTFRHVVLMPGIRNVLPALTNQFIILFLFSSIGSVISLDELTAVLENLNSQTLRTFEIFTIGALLYFLTSAAIAYGARAIEKVAFKW